MCSRRIRGTAVIGDTVWWDTNQNGVRDPGGVGDCGRDGGVEEPGGGR